MSSTRKVTLTAIDTWTCHALNRETGKPEPKEYVALRFTPIRGAGAFTFYSYSTATDRVVGDRYTVTVDGGTVLTAKKVSA